MPIVRAKQQIQTQAIPDVSNNQRLTANDFGSAIGDGLQDVARANASERIAQANKEAAERRRDEQLALAQAGTEADKVTLELGNQYRTKEYGDAPAAKQETLDQFNERLGNIEVPEHLRPQWEATKERKKLMFRGQVEAHENQQFKALEQKTEQDAIQTSTELAVANRTNKILVGMEVAKAKVMIKATAGDSPENKKIANEKADLVAGKIHTAVIQEALQNNELHVAGGFLEDKNVLAVLPERVANKLKTELDNKITNRDIYVDVSKIIEDQTLENDFSQESKDAIYAEKADMFKGDPRELEKVEQYKRQFDASWSSARSEQNRKDGEYLGKLAQELAQPGMTKGQAQFIANQAPEHLRAAANARVASIPDADAGEDDGLDANENDANEQIARDAIAQGFITNTGDLMMKFGDRLPKASMARLEKMFNTDEGKKLRAIETDLGTALKYLQPESNSKEMTRLKSMIGPIIRKRIGNTEPTYEKIEAMTKLLLMDTAITTSESRSPNPNIPVSRYRLKSDALEVIEGIDNEAIQARADNFSNLVPVVIPKKEMDEVERRMRADGLNPEVNDPREYYRTKFLNLAPLGSSEKVESRKRAARGLGQIAQEEASLARETFAFGGLREQMNSYVYNDSNGKPAAFGNRAMSLQLQDSAQQGAPPDWMNKVLVDMGSDAQGITALDKFNKKLTSAPDKAQVILETGLLLLARAAQ